jgi:aryl-alcohol dehydrogenase-like predicted oxidoreductase
MEYRTLGASDLAVSEIGFGGWAIGGHGYGKVDDRVSKEAVRKALDLGVNFFDTANVYGFGHSEIVLSEALGERRHEVVIATKVGVKLNREGNTYRDCSPRSIMESLEGSLRRLRLDCIPLYQIHWPDGKTRIGEIMEVLEKCREAGKIKHIGCCNLSLELIKEATCSGKLVSVQTLYNVKRRENEGTLRKCFYGLGMGAITYEVLGRGLFSGRYGKSVSFGKNDTRTKEPEFYEDNLDANLNIGGLLAKVGERYGKSAAQVAIRWTLDKPFVTCALVGAKTPEQVEENVASVGCSLTEEDLEILDSWNQA